MVIYKVTCDYKDIKKDTKLTFNKSRQYFETLNHEYFITNSESAKHPYLIVIHKVLTKKSEDKKIIIIPF